MKRILSAICVLLASGPLGHAQYAEPDVQVLLERSIGPAGNGFALKLVALGDVDGDGVPDLAASDHGVQFAGRVQALSGLDGSTLWTRTVPNSGELGVSLERIDWNEDGVLDVVAGAPGFDFLSVPTKVFSGSNGTLLANLQPTATGFGRTLAAGGDLDGNGVPDLLVGSPTDDAAGGHVDAYARGSTAPFGVLHENNEGVCLGSGLAFLGDIDVVADGRAEIAVGTGGCLSGSGRIRVYGWQGSNFVQRYELVLPQVARDLDGGEDLDGDGLPDLVAATHAGVRVYSGADGALLRTLSPSELFEAVALIEDQDHDGVADIAAGAPTNSSGAPNGGKVFFHSGATGVLLRTITSTTPQRRLGQDLCAFGDRDGDGQGDLLVGAYSSSASSAVGSVLVFALPSPGIVLNFDAEDDLQTPLVNGQHIDTEFGRRVTISSAGANAGLSIFDSTLGGPNDPGPDLDLLVHTGNLLVLQAKNVPPDENDVFPEPDSDDDGGTMRFEFPRSIEARSLRLVDVDAADGTSVVVLNDSSGRQRTYTVPADWTGDRTLAQPGHGTLDLVTLAPQPGLGSTATVVEDAGFDAAAVTSIDVELAGSVGVDDVTWCVSGSGLAQAAATVRNGSGVNPLLLRNSATPVLGGSWAVQLDCSGHGSGLASLIIATQPGQFAWTYGEVLIQGPRLWRWSGPHLGSSVSITACVPNDLSLEGLSAHAQGVCTGGGSVELSNALDLVLGY